MFGTQIFYASTGQPMIGASYVPYPDGSKRWGGGEIQFKPPREFGQIPEGYEAKMKAQKEYNLKYFGEYNKLKGQATTEMEGILEAKSLSDEVRRLTVEWMTLTMFKEFLERESFPPEVILLRTNEIDALMVNLKAAKDKAAKDKAAKDKAAKAEA